MNIYIKIIEKIIIQENYFEYEKIIVAFNRENIELNKANILRYIQFMNSGSNSGGEIEICLFNLCIRKQVHLYEKNEQIFEIFGSDTNGILYLYYCDLNNDGNMNHYDVLLPRLDKSSYIASEIPTNEILNKHSEKSFSCIPVSEQNIGPIEVHDDGNKSGKQGNEVNVDIYASGPAPRSEDAGPIRDRYQYLCKQKLKYLKYKIKYLLIKNISQ
jgi:hypothetical protein